MKQETKGWVIANERHPETYIKYIISEKVYRTRAECIAKFIEGTSETWEYWHKTYKFRCVKAIQTIQTIDR